MRTAIASTFAILLLAVMPAFALLRYEQTRATDARAGRDTASQATAATEDGGGQTIPSIGSGAHAASPATIFQRSIALEALKAIEDSIPRAAGSSPPEWGDISARRDPDGVSWPVAISARFRQCAATQPPDGACSQTRNAIVTVYLRLLQQDIERADVLARWFAGPPGRQGYFLVVLERENGAWRAARIDASAGPAERPIN